MMTLILTKTKIGFKMMLMLESMIRMKLGGHVRNVHLSMEWKNLLVSYVVKE